MSTVESFFRKHKDINFLLVNPGGNTGDHMIWAGGRKLADRTNVKYTTIRGSPIKPTPRVGKDTIIYVHGCGGFCPWNGWIFTLLKRLREVNPDNFLVVGPSTVSLDQSFMGDGLSGGFIDVFFTRDLNSFDMMKNFIGEFVDSVYIDHDQALSLCLGDGYLEKITHMTPNSLKNNYSLLALREHEAEKANVCIDASKFNVVSPEPFYGRGWGKHHYEANTIVTNRLHSAILGSVIGKPTYLIRGRWHKQRSVWEYSLKQRGVKWYNP